jgi:tetratricopeptide (TPR) repeat protein
VKEFDRAIADYNEALRLDPKNRLAYLNRGIAWQAGGDFAKAIADYDQAIERGLKTAQAYNNRGHAWELKKDYDRAIADYTEAIRLGPNSPLSWLNRGNAWKAKGKFDEALADYQSATRLEPKSPWGYALQASLLAAPPGRSTRPAPAQPAAEALHPDLERPVRRLNVGRQREWQCRLEPGRISLAVRRPDEFLLWRQLRVAPDRRLHRPIDPRRDHQHRLQQSRLDLLQRELPLLLGLRRRPPGRSDELRLEL